MWRDYPESMVVINKQIGWPPKAGGEEGAG
jgi:hypothetical protein